MVASVSSLMKVSRLRAARAGRASGAGTPRRRCAARCRRRGGRRGACGHAFGAERLGAGDAVGVEDECGGPAGGELGDPAERVGVVERALEFGVEDRVGVAGLVAAGVADGLLAFLVGPAGAVGDHIAVVSASRWQTICLRACSWPAVGSISPARMSCPSPRFAGSPRRGVHGLLLARGVLGGGVAELGVVDTGAGEERLLAGGLCVAGRVRRVEGEVDHERGVDDPDAGGEVLAAVVHERVAPGAGAVADLGGDPELQRPGPGARGERVELGVELVGLAPSMPRVAGGRLGEVGAGVLDLLGGVEHRAVVDPHRVGVLVLDHGAVHERAEVAVRLVVQVAAGDPGGDRLGELRGDLCMSARRLAIVTDSCSPVGRSATRSRIASGRVSWRRRL